LLAGPHVGHGVEQSAVPTSRDQFSLDLGSQRRQRARRSRLAALVERRASGLDFLGRRLPSGDVLGRCCGLVARQRSLFQGQLGVRSTGMPLLGPVSAGGA
jgi:hypothetical protein